MISLKFANIDITPQVLSVFIIIFDPYRTPNQHQQLTTPNSQPKTHTPQLTTHNSQLITLFTSNSYLHK
jgi:hypothetical protein